MSSTPRQAAPPADADTSAVTASADGTTALRSTSAAGGTRGPAVPGSGDEAAPTQRSAAPAAVAADV